MLTELDHLVHRDLGFPAALQVMEALNARIADGQYRLADLRHAELVAAQEIREKYGNPRLDLAWPTRSAWYWRIATTPTASSPSTSVTSGPSHR